MKNKLIALGLIVAVIAGGAYGYTSHTRNQLISSIAPSIKNASIRISNTAKLQTDKSNITFQELFSHIDADTAELDKRSIDIQSISNKDNSDITAPAIAYLHDCEEFSRAFSMKYRKELAFSNSIDHVKGLLSEPAPSSSYELEYEKNRRDQGVKEMNEAAAAATAADADLVAATKRLKESRSKIANIFPDDALVESKQLDAIIKENSPKPKTKDDKNTPVG